MRPVERSVERLLPGWDEAHEIVRKNSGINRPWGIPGLMTLRAAEDDVVAAWMAAAWLAGKRDSRPPEAAS